jgi:biopolymer transport protein ExbD
MSDINMTPLIDVMLVLLVIFIITAPLWASSIKLDLPQTSAAQVTEVPQSVTVVMDASGQTFVNDRPVTLEELSRHLAQCRRDGCGPKGGLEPHRVRGRQLIGRTIHPSHQPHHRNSAE